MTNLAQVFPTRPLRILTHGIGGAWLNMLIGLGFLAAAVGILFWQAPDLLHDNVIRQNPVVVPDATVRNGRCRTRKFVFVECQGDISYTVAGRRYQHSVDVMFADFGSDPREATVVRSADHPEYATFGFAIDLFWTRVVTVLGFAGFMGALAAAGFVTGWQNARLRRAAGSAGALTPVYADLTKAVQEKSIVTFSFSAEIDGRTRNFASRLTKDEAPLRGPDGRAIAVIPQGSKTPILLDERLQRLDLTGEERQRIWAALGYETQAA